MDFEKTIAERYRVKYESKKDCFFILDTWHEQIKNIADFNSDIPEDSPALKIISGGEANALVSELEKKGWVKKDIIKEPTSKNIIKMSFKEKIDSLFEISGALKNDYYSKRNGKNKK